jgi:glycosyltransferase involved in cell wall biosynthesis
LPHKVSVVVRVGPHRRYLGEALESLRAQTFTDYELIIDDRPGFVRALNDSCQRASGEYIAIQDSDDISYPMRLQTEVEYLERHPDVSVVGTWGRRIGLRSGICRPPTNVTITHLFLWSRVLHTSTMMRRDDVMPFGPYRNVEGEDWDLWIRLVKAGKKVRNIPVPLVAFRFHSENRTKFLKKGPLLAAHLRERMLCLPFVN